MKSLFLFQISGHKNLQSVNNYSTIKSSQQRSISRVLSNTLHQPVTHHDPSLSSSSSCLSGSMTTFTPDRSCKVTTPFLFGGPIYGGTFNVTVNNNTPSPSSAPIKKRTRVIYSDSDSETNSWMNGLAGKTHYVVKLLRRII